MSQQLLTEGIDYHYNEEGLMVLTDSFLLKRGYCCGKGCTHCPYQYEKVPEPLRSKLLAERSSS